MAIQIESKRKSIDNIRKSYGADVEIIDVTSKGSQPWVKFSPFYPHGQIPVPLHPELVGQSVEGIWQALKVFEQTGVDFSKLDITNMKGIKRTTRSLGRVLGHQGESDGLLSYLDARKQIYLPCYKWVLENRLQSELKQITQLIEQRNVVLLDYETNGDINDLRKPLSHASLVKYFIEGIWPP